MTTICRRLARLERAIPSAAAAAMRWGRLAGIRDQLLTIAKGRSSLAAEQLKSELDELGPSGLWREAARGHLKANGIVQSDQESFAETIARALGISIRELRAQLVEGRIGAALVERFSGTE